MRKSICVLLSVLLLSAMPAMAGQDDLGSVRIRAVADAPVTLSDATSFEAPLSLEIEDGMISAERRELASAVSASKFLDGAATVVATVILLAVLF